MVVYSKHTLHFLLHISTYTFSSSSHPHWCVGPTCHPLPFPFFPSSSLSPRHTSAIAGASSPNSGCAQPGTLPRDFPMVDGRSVPTPPPPHHHLLSVATKWHACGARTWQVSLAKKGGIWSFEQSVGSLFELNFDVLSCQSLPWVVGWRGSWSCS